MNTLAHDWRCPDCGLDIHSSLRLQAATHNCYGPGHKRTVPRSVALRPVDTAWPAPAGTATQLRLDA